MAISLFIEKREWTKDELMTAQKIFCDNDFARDVLESIFKDHATKNAAETPGLSIAMICISG